MITFLRAGRRAERQTNDPLPNLAARHGSAVAWLAMAVSTGFGVGYALDRLLLATVLSVFLGAAGVWFFLSRRRTDAPAPTPRTA